MSPMFETEEIHDSVEPLVLALVFLVAPEPCDHISTLLVSGGLLEEGSRVVVLEFIASDLLRRVLIDTLKFISVAGRTSWSLPIALSIRC